MSASVHEFGADKTLHAVGPYTLLRLLGQGGMAETYLAMRHGRGDFQQQVCLKQILSSFAQDEEFRTLFEREALLMARLRHANITQLLDCHFDKDQPYLVLEYVDGCDLRQLITTPEGHARRLAPEIVGCLGFELAMALDYAHNLELGSRQSGIVHRDISPGNILLSLAGEVKLTDFGIAKAVSEHTARSQVIKGKVAYMAPEYALQGRYSRRSDLYALGVTLYEALAGRRPYEGETDLSTLDMAERGDRPPLRQLAPETPEALAAAIEHLIEADSRHRTQSASDFLDQLEPLRLTVTIRRQLARVVRSTLGREEAKAAAEHAEVAAAAAMPRSQADTHPRAALGTADTLMLDQAQDVATRTFVAEGEQAQALMAAAVAQSLAAKLSDPAVAKLPASSAAREQTHRALQATRKSRSMSLRTKVAGAAAICSASIAVGAYLVAKRQSAAPSAATAGATNAQPRAAPNRSRDDQAQPPAPAAEVPRANAKPGAEALRETATTTGSGLEPAASPDRQPSAQPSSASQATGIGASTRERRPVEPTPKGKPTQTKTKPRRARRTQYGWLTLRVPEGHKIWVDGRLKGTTTLRLRLRAGSHTIGHGLVAPTRHRSITVKRGQRLVLRF